MRDDTVFLNLPDAPAERWTDVKVYDAEGKLVRVISREELEARPDPLPRDWRSYDLMRRRRREERRLGRAA